MPTVVGPYRFKTAVSIDLPSINAGSATDVTVNIAGLKANAPVMAWPESINAGLVWTVYCVANGVLRIRVANVTGSAIDPAAVTWHVVQF